MLIKSSLKPDNNISGMKHVWPLNTHSLVVIRRVYYNYESSDLLSTLSIRAMLLVLTTIYKTIPSLYRGAISINLCSLTDTLHNVHQVFIVSLLHMRKSESQM